MERERIELVVVVLFLVVMNRVQHFVEATSAPLIFQEQKTCISINRSTSPGIPLVKLCITFFFLLMIAEMKTGVKSQGDEDSEGPVLQWETLKNLLRSIGSNTGTLITPVHSHTLR